jgi:hypothetical protein
MASLSPVCQTALLVVASVAAFCSLAGPDDRLDPATVWTGVEPGFAPGAGLAPGARGYPGGRVDEGYRYLEPGARSAVRGGTRSARDWVPAPAPPSDGSWPTWPSVDPGGGDGSPPHGTGRHRHPRSPWAIDDRAGRRQHEELAPWRRAASPGPSSGGYRFRPDDAAGGDGPGTWPRGYRFRPLTAEELERRAAGHPVWRPPERPRRTPVPDFAPLAPEEAYGYRSEGWFGRHFGGANR